MTDGDTADFLIALAKMMPEGAPTLFLVGKDLTRVSVKRVPHYTHTFVYDHPEFLLEEVRVGADAVPVGIGHGYDLTRAWFTAERPMNGADTIGAAESALSLHTADSLDLGEFLAAPFLVQFLTAAEYQLSWSIDVSGYSRCLPPTVGVRSSFWWNPLGAGVGGT
ncbi:hypothetical protein ACFXPA_42180 [Amycolatopsis sp. NPDC059090]|uniref:hypothetical protein n=1 Tax=Amycolatopsis sp. NPDC059090 TaxID=3346723 RepID=UPI00366AAB69